ncbi:MAG: serine hydrolase [Acidobacteriota bacterium]
MNRSPKVIAVLTMIALLSVAGVAQAGGNAALVSKTPELSEALTVLDSWIQKRMHDREQPGLSVGVVYDQELIWAKGYGVADLARKTPVTSETAFRIGSVSKLFTATAIMQLRDAGKLHLDDPVSMYLPWFRIKSSFVNAPAITIRQLMTHTSGLPRESPGGYWNTGEFPTREQMIEALAQQEAILEPATELKYSNLAVSIEGEVVQAVSGEPYEQYVTRHILEPLGMLQSSVRPQPDSPALAVGYAARQPGQPRAASFFLQSGGLTPAANIASTVPDLAKFMSLQFRDAEAGGPQILKGSTLREMRHVQWLNSDWTGGYGLGFSLSRVGDKVRVGHGGAVNGFRASVRFLPDEKFGVIVLANSGDGDPGSYSDELFKVLEPIVAKATKKDDPPSVADPSWSKFVGTYTWEGDDVRVMVIGGKLTMFNPGADDPWGSRNVLEPIGQNTFRFKGGYASGEIVRFELDKSGKVTRVDMPGEFAIRTKD